MKRFEKLLPLQVFGPQTQPLNIISRKRWKKWKEEEDGENSLLLKVVFTLVTPVEGKKGKCIETWIEEEESKDKCVSPDPQFPESIGRKVCHPQEGVVYGCLIWKGVS